MDTCKLTEKKGVFVKSHLIPKALTRLSRVGEKAIEAGPVIGPKRKPEGWYDKQLVISEGERILESYDTAGIRELRRLGLIWSSATHCLDAAKKVSIAGEQDLLEIACSHPKRLRMFILSLLWRAAATALPAFSHFELPEGERLFLRRLLAENSAGLVDEFCTIFTVLGGPGAQHNHTPIRDKLILNDLQLTYSRFYFDGLVIHIYDRDASKVIYRQARALLVGFDKRLVVMSRKFNDSRQERDLIDVMRGVNAAV